MKPTDCSDKFYLFLKIQSFVNFERQNERVVSARPAEYHVKFDVSVLSSRRTVLRLLYFEQSTRYWRIRKLGIS